MKLSLLILSVLAVACNCTFFYKQYGKKFDSQPINNSSKDDKILQEKRGELYTALPDQENLELNYQPRHEVSNEKEVSSETVVSKTVKEYEVQEFSSESERKTKAKNYGKSMENEKTQNNTRSAKKLIRRYLTTTKNSQKNSESSIENQKMQKYTFDSPVVSEIKDSENKDQRGIAESNVETQNVQNLPETDNKTPKDDIYSEKNIYKKYMSYMENAKNNSNLSVDNQKEHKYTRALSLADNENGNQNSAVELNPETTNAENSAEIDNKMPEYNIYSVRNVFNRYITSMETSIYNSGLPGTWNSSVSNQPDQIYTYESPLVCKLNHNENRDKRDVIKSNQEIKNTQKTAKTKINNNMEIPKDKTIIEDRLCPKAEGSVERQPRSVQDSGMLLYQGEHIQKIPKHPKVWY